MFLYVVRHGETEANLAGIIQGHSDTPLTALGVAQAEAVAKRLAGEEFDAIYSSDLGRAFQTAEIIASYHRMQVEKNELLREASYGEFQGLTRAQVEELDPGLLERWNCKLIDAAAPGGETPADVMKRSEIFLNKLAGRHCADSKVCVVGHGGSLRALFVIACRLPAQFYRNLHFSNASLSILEIADAAGIWTLNDTCHLKSIGETSREGENWVQDTGKV